MALYIPTVNNVTSPIPQVLVTMQGTITYTQFLQSLGADAYEFDKVYIWSSNIGQLTAPIKYEYRNVNGDSQTEIITPKIDPYQSSPALYVDLSCLTVPLIINNVATISFALAPNTTIRFKFIGDVSKNTDFLSGMNNFEEVSFEMGMEDFFDSQDKN